MFKDGSTSLGSSTVANGVATFTASSLAGGSHSLTAAYSGDANDNSGVSSALTQTVTQGTVTVTLASTPNPSVMGQSVTITATVVPSSATGTITFNDGSTAIATVTLSGGTASTTTSTLAIGSHSLTADYSGDSNYASAVSSPGPALNFTTAVPEGTILDVTGKGTGFTTRLPAQAARSPARIPTSP